MPEPLLDVRALDAFYGDFQALFGVSMRVEPGQVVAVIGANGAGKSTLLQSIAGLMRPRRGDIVFDGEPIGGAARLRRGAARHRHGAGGAPAVSLAHRRGEPQDRRPGRRPGPWTLERVYELFPVLAERRHLPARRSPAASSRWRRSPAR